ncbi:ABC transporter ATP-binding protein [Amphibacillus xylanus]|uniref:Putative ABC transporter ATP-binding protein n=1 Tax=Amphibacillus xylanus (strain ATCC 51415 / DSM 6626 / JCM 7361 / LMG 17667 / NBRC 15112 / Ep01) TaxID=698758 RepID=K0J7Q7_AMPXN|nr:ABC transporter ATP-binding protein [Amphibacillus xylanus]BAM47788.1 putative ABC transporter ATP-binding protein [Amphibacillus xylanus NBRC 15112]
MINIQDLTKSYGRKKVVNNVNLQINKGSIYGLLGSNGAGKTTILKMVSGILKQQSGTIIVDDEAIFENTNRKAKLIFIPDRPYFFSHYTVQQMAEFYRNFYPNWNEERFIKLQSIFKLDIKSKVHQFSKGMQRQVSFWLALSAMPDYLILDEPFDGLDVVVRKKVKNLIINDVAEREMTVMISSHNLREIEDICDHIGILHNGEFVLEKELDDLKSDVHKVQVAFDGDFPEQIFNQFEVLHQEKRGTVHLFILRGNRDQIDESILAHQPLIYDLLPLTLEEIFVYEMEGIGYAIENILV